ncbi:hypothetical protein Bbelb_334090 [Branchiostoma belcheri]|nr:hypothetical protein Bbelb_334090 [Branchiostoma belcheri]
MTNGGIPKYPGFPPATPPSAIYGSDPKFPGAPISSGTPAQPPAPLAQPPGVQGQPPGVQGQPPGVQGQPPGVQGQPPGVQGQLPVLPVQPAGVPAQPLAPPAQPAAPPGQPPLATGPQSIQELTVDVMRKRKCEWRMGRLTSAVHGLCVNVVYKRMCNGDGCSHLVLASREIQVGDYWPSDVAYKHIAVNEICALTKTLEASVVTGKRILARVDNTTLIAAWNNQGGRSIGVQRNHRALGSDGQPKRGSGCGVCPFRKSDARLLPHLFHKVDAAFEWHDTDLMALPSNVQENERGQKLRFFSPHPAEGDPGRIRQEAVTTAFLLEQRADATIVVPDLPRQSWWPVLQAQSGASMLVVNKGTHKGLRDVRSAAQGSVDRTTSVLRHRTIMVVSSNKDSPTVLSCLYLINHAWNRPNSSNSCARLEQAKFQQQHRECFFRRSDNRDICLENVCYQTTA